MLDAASANQSIYSIMYPKLPDGVFEDQLHQLEASGFFRILMTASGASYLSLCPAGEEFMNTLSEKEKRKTLASVEKFMATGAAGATIVQGFCAVWPYIQSMLTK